MLILHLSDIHFRKAEVSTAQDPNFNLRNELLLDVAEQCARLGAPDVIVVGGDVAFAGDPAEFVFATDWLQQLCDVCGSSLEKVFVVPGNHDVVRSQADAYMVQLLHGAIKASASPITEITKQLLGKDTGRLLYESLDNYNAFALQFFCDLLPPERTRVKRDVLLNDGSTLRLWGLNTAFVSSGSDVPRSLFVDAASWQITRHPGVVNLVVAHHHLSWLFDGEKFGYHLADVAPVQMFGHVHTNRIDRNVDYLRLTASAVNPDRRENGWEPGYNFLELEVEDRTGERWLALRAHVRVWQEAPSGFVAKRLKESDVWDHAVRLEPWSPSAASAPVFPLPLASGVLQAPVDSKAPVEASAQAGEGGEMDTLRDVGLRFYRLSFSKKSEIAGRLGLLEEEDVRQPDFERFRRVFLRAHERGRLDELAAAVRTAEQR